MTALRVIAPGPLTTVQDGGRSGYQHLGISPGGAADLRALRLANHLVGNPPDAATLEVTLGGLVLQAEAPFWAGVVGVTPACTVDGRAVPSGETVAVGAGALMRIAGSAGARTYVAFAGGIAVPPVLGARSADLRADFPGLLGRPLRSGDLLELQGAPAPAARRLRVEWAPRRRAEIIVTCSPGPEAAIFPPESSEILRGASFTVTPQADRTGVRLAGPRIPGAQREILSEGQPAGAIQVPPDGAPIVLLSGRPTVGGYAKIAVVSPVDLWELAQCLPGDRIRFRLAEVEQVGREARRRLRTLEQADRCTRLRPQMPL